LIGVEAPTSPFPFLDYLSNIVMMPNKHTFPFFQAIHLNRSSTTFSH
jgi:hypothetical protein